MRKRFITVLLSLSVIGGAPFLLSACNTAAGVKEDVADAAHAISGGTDRSTPEATQARQSQSTATYAHDTRVEARIKSLHDRLRVTSAQEPQWSAVAQTMRDNAHEMQEAIAQRQQARSLTAVDDLKAFEVIADTHSQGLEKLIPAFQALYDTMSDDQKRNADAIFSKRHHDRRAMHKAADAGTLRPDGTR
jgi:predicted small secreted protein